MKWNYESPTERSTGYEDIMDYLATFNKDNLDGLSKDEQEEKIEEVYRIYSDRDIFPITYLNNDGIKDEISKCMEYTPEIKDGILNCGAGVGTTLCNFMFPNMFLAYNTTTIRKCNVDCLSCYLRFKNKRELLRAIRFAVFACDGGAVPSNIMGGFRMCGIIPTNFRPMNAKALYEKYCPENGVIYDFSCGYGGRMLGALTSKKNFSYVGVEPNSETYNNLGKLGKHIEEYTGRENSYKVLKIGSEDFKANPEIFDFAFSSPPYFNLEVYSDEVTQCYNRYPNIYDWLDYYVKKTIENTFYMLKHDRYYAVNINDFKNNGRVINYVEIWKDYAIKAGFEYVETLYLRMSAHKGSGRFTDSRSRGERVIVFYKK